MTAWQEDPGDLNDETLLTSGLPTDTQATSGQARAAEQQFEQQRRWTTSDDSTPG